MKTRTFKLQLQGREFEVRVEDVEEKPSFELTPPSIKDDALPITIDRDLYEVKIGREVTPQTAPPTLQKAEEKVERAVEVEGKPVKAPLRGTITKILVKVGDKVKEGDTLALLEAMKMENIIEAPSSGVIKAVKISKGNNVGAGDVLFIME